MREPSEYDICKIEGSILVPLGDVKARDQALLNGLNPADEIITHCHHGVRSLTAAEILKEMGFTNVKSMSGGIDEWSVQVDESVARY